jgi:protein-S-isoprenylcysteine O-methyltransferase Ste14
MSPFEIIELFRRLALGLWLLFLLIWCVAALRTKRTSWRAPYSTRVQQMIFILAGAYLLANRSAFAPTLDRALYPMTPAVALFGLLLVLSGIAFSVWARFILGTNWSGMVTLKDDHTLVRSGPYRFVRHPIYSGILLALIGSAFQLGLVRGFLGVVLFAIGFWFKLRVEEQLMTEHFGEQYVAYRREVKALVPFVF